MDNNVFEFKLLIEPKDIYDKLTPEQKERFKDIKITNITLYSDGNVEIECLALMDRIIKSPNRQKLLGDWHITVA